MTYTGQQSIWWRAVLPLLAATPLVLSLALMFSHPFRGNAAADLLTFASLTMAGYLLWRRKSLPSPVSVLLLASSLATLSFFFLSGLLELPPTPVPQMRIYLKVLFAGSCLVIVAGSRSNVSLVVITALLACNPLLGWHFQGVTLRALPLAVYLACTTTVVLRESPRIFARDLTLPGLTILCIVAAAQSPMKGAGLFSSAAWVGALFLFWIGRHADSEALAHALTGLRAGYGLVVVLLVSLSVALVLQEAWALGQAAAVGYNPNGLATFLALLSPLVVTWSPGERRAVRWGSVILLVVALVLVFGFGARSALAAAGGGLAVLVVIRLRISWFARSENGEVARHPRRSNWLAACAAAAILTATLLATALSGKGVESLTIRRSIWSMYAQNAWRHGGILGFGPEAYALNFALSPNGLSANTRQDVARFVSSFGDTVHSHSLLLQSWFDWGPAGAALLLLLLGTAAWRARRMPSDASRIAILGSLVALGLHACLEYSLADAAVLLPLAFLLGVWYRPLEGEGGGRTLPAKRVRAILLPMAVLMLSACIWVAYNTWIQQRMLRITGPTATEPNGNLRLLGRLSASQSRTLLDLENKFLPNMYDWRLQAYRGQVLMALETPQATQLALERFESCIVLYRYSTTCARGLTAAHERSGRPEEAARWRRKAREFDPWRTFDSRRIDGQGLLEPLQVAAVQESKRIRFADSSGDHTTEATRRIRLE